MIDWQNIIAALAMGGTIFAALYARWCAREAKKANDIGNLNALLALRTHYLALMQNQEKLAQLLAHSPSGLQAAQNTYADLDLKLREVNQEIDKRHTFIIGLSNER